MQGRRLVVFGVPGRMLLIWGLMSEYALWIIVGLAVAAVVVWVSQAGRRRVRRAKAQAAKAREAHYTRTYDQTLIDQADPPWESPRRVEERISPWAFDSLMARLTLVRRVEDKYDDVAYYKDTQTGQVWLYTAEERGYGNWVAELFPAELPPVVESDPPPSE